MRKPTSIFPFFLLTIFCTGVIVFAVLQASYEIPCTLTIEGVGLGVYTYDQNAGYSRLEYIDWGILEPNETKAFNLFVHNEIGEPCLMTLNTTDWKPEIARNYISLSWDYDENWLEIDEYREVNLFIHVANDVCNVTTFEFAIVLSAWTT